MPRLFPLIVMMLLPVSSFAGDELTFESDIKPVFQRHCAKCHSDESKKAELDLTSRTGLLRGGESGELFDRDNPEQGLLYEMVAEGHMPPEGNEPLSEAQLELLRRWILGGIHFAESPAETTAAISQHDVIPILHRRCTMCHGAVQHMGGLDARTPEGLQAGGESGAAFVAGDPAESLMLSRITEKLCPPQADIGEAGIEPTTTQELAVLTRWIEAGAPSDPMAPDEATEEPDPLVTDADREFWSFQPPRKSQIPMADGEAIADHPIDAFLLEKLHEAGLTYSPAADRLTLLRRATFDLTGLPPTPEQITAYLSDDRADAYPRLIDRLLDSPHNGERWGRMWLDVAGYADSEGKRSADMVRPWAWRYRDYVIQSFNADKPFDDFLVEQIAGDELVDWADQDAMTPEIIEKLVATGFLRMAPDGTTANPVNRLSDRIEVIADEIDVLGRGVLGLTLKCAQCHSHKYDPIPQRDYYRLVAVFRGAYDEYEWMSPQPFTNQWKNAQHRYLDLAMPEERQEIDAFNVGIDQQIADVKAQLEAVEDDADQKKKLDKQIKDLEAQRKSLPRIRALWDRGAPSPTYVYRRGDETQPARLVGPGVPSVLTDGQTPFVPLAPEHSTPKTGRRLALARWLTQPDHPLTARVFVNRLWKEHFGRGIVASLDNFGSLGEAASHPELLDWLAVEFVERGWSVKEMHRLMMTSAAYQQQSTISDDLQRLDPDNRLLSRMPMRRLSAEEVRDSLLLTADRLSPRPFGPPDAVDVRKDGLVTSQLVDGAWRRSIYVRQRRKEMPTLLETFDLPQMNPNCVTRATSTIVSQPLYLLNNKMVYELAESFAQRVARESEDYPDARVRQAWLIACGRDPNPEELELAVEALSRFEHERTLNDTTEPSEDVKQSALVDFCHALMNSAEFLFVD